MTLIESELRAALRAEAAAHRPDREAILDRITEAAMHNRQAPRFRVAGVAVAVTAILGAGGFAQWAVAGDSDPTPPVVTVEPSPSGPAPSSVSPSSGTPSASPRRSASRSRPPSRSPGTPATGTTPPAVQATAQGVQKFQSSLVDAATGRLTAAESVRAIQMAAIRGDATSQNALGVMYAHGIGVLRTKVESGDSGWDIVIAESEELQIACEEGLILPLDIDRLGGKDNYVPGAVSECGIGAAIYNHVLAYDKSRISAPPSWADFFDLAKYPGKRSMRNSPKTSLEFALLADGVKPDEVYKVLSTPEGVDRAFAKSRMSGDGLQEGQVGRGSRDLGLVQRAAKRVDGGRAVVRMDDQLSEHRVIVADLFDETAIARRARVGDDDVVVGALLGASAGETDLERHALVLESCC